MTFDIEFINTVEPTVRNCDDFAVAFADLVVNCDSTDIGGLEVYTVGSRAVAVYDYENECAWIV
jgi:hypothetical protein